MADEIDVKKLSDEEVKSQSLEDKSETKEVEVKTPGTKCSKFFFYLSDAAADPPNVWRCLVSNDLFNADIIVSDALDSKIDVDALFGRFWLAAFNKI